MDEARRVIARLERIETLRREGAPSPVLLCEVRGLLEEGETWLEAERTAARRAGSGEGELEAPRDVLGRLRASVERGPVARKGVVAKAAVYHR